MFVTIRKQRAYIRFENRYVQKTKLKSQDFKMRSTEKWYQGIPLFLTCAFDGSFWRSKDQIHFKTSETTNVKKQNKTKKTNSV